MRASTMPNKRLSSWAFANTLSSTISSRLTAYVVCVQSIVPIRRTLFFIAIARRCAGISIFTATTAATTTTAEPLLGMTQAAEAAVPSPLHPRQAVTGAVTVLPRPVAMPQAELAAVLRLRSRLRQAATVTAGLVVVVAVVDRLVVL